MTVCVASLATFPQVDSEIESFSESSRQVGGQPDHAHRLCASTSRPTTQRALTKQRIGICSSACNSSSVGAGTS